MSRSFQKTWINLVSSYRDTGPLRVYVRFFYCNETAFLYRAYHHFVSKYTSGEDRVRRKI